jgi:hypothetical protein
MTTLGGGMVLGFAVAHIQNLQESGALPGGLD